MSSTLVSSEVTTFLTKQNVEMSLDGRKEKIRMILRFAFKVRNISFVGRVNTSGSMIDGKLSQFLSCGKNSRNARVQ